MLFLHSYIDRPDTTLTVYQSLFYAQHFSDENLAIRVLIRYEKTIYEILGAIQVHTHDFWMTVKKS